MSTPGKFFFSVPENERRRSWCVAVGRDPDSLSLTSKRRCCQDHFKIEEDVENWLYYKTLLDANVLKMPSLRLKKEVLPRMVENVGKNVTSTTRENSPISCPGKNAGEEAFVSSSPKSQSRQEHQNDDCTVICQTPANSPLLFPDDDGGREAIVFSGPVAQGQNGDNDPSTFCKVQTSQGEDLEHDAEMNEVQKQFTLEGKRRKRSIGTQKNVSTANKETQTSKIMNGTGTWTVSQSPPKRQRIAEDLTPSSESEPRSGEVSEYKPSSQTTLSSSQGTQKELQDLELKTSFVYLYQVLMERSPMRHLGISKDKLGGFVDIITKFTGLSKRNIFIVLRKIRKNESFDDLSEIFGVSKATISSVLHESIPILSEYLSTFIIWPSSRIIKSNLPAAFRSNYSQVESIIDCFEIFITKPRDAVRQAQVYSEYKHHTTIKYFISVTPDGLINFVSRGFGGRTSDVQITKKSGFLKALKPGIIVMADRGFKQIAPLLIKKIMSISQTPKRFFWCKIVKV